MKVRIKKVPKARTGYQVRGALANDVPAMGGADYDSYIGIPDIKMNRTLKKVPREEANLEAEGNETVMMNTGNIPAFYTIKGPRHAQGGVPLNLPDDSFIYSDFREMKIKDPALLAKFGKSVKGKTAYTPAQLSKQYDINKYREILQDPNSDAIDRKTAELMLRNYNMKLGSLALAQESKKGFPQGIPAIAEPYMQANKISLEDIMPDYQPRFAQQEQEVEDAEYEEMPMEMPSGEQIAMSPEMMEQQMPSEFAYGGYIPQAQNGLIIKPYEEARTPEGNITPTGKQNKFSQRKQQVKDYLNTWEEFIPGVSKLSEGQAQAAIYDWNLKNNPDAIRNMWRTYGLTAKGMKSKNLRGLSKDAKGQFEDELLSDEATLAKLKDAYVDNYFGVRQLDPKKKEEKKEEAKKKVETVVEEEVEEEVTRPDLNQVNVPQPPGISPAAWTAPDLRNYFGAYKDKYSLRKYFPWAASVDLEEPLPVYYDPTRELAQQSEQVNMITQGLGQFAGPQALSSRASQVQATGAKQAADTLARYNNLNVGLANQFEQLQSNVRNQERMMNQGIAKELYDKNVITNQSFDNAKRSADANIRQAFATGWKNASDISMINATSEQYEVDPRTGTVYFQRGKDIRPERAASFDRILQGYIRQGFDPKDAIAAAKVASGDTFGYSGPALASNYKDGGMYVMGSNVFPFMFY
jgi:hypothetical protein